MASTRRAFPRRAAALAALAVVSAAATARAADVNPALVEPTLAPGGIWAVGTTPTPTALAVWGELAATFANDELATRTADGVTAGPLRNRLVTTLIAGMALPEVLDVAVGVPLDVVEVPGADGARDGEVALGDVRLEARARLLTPAPSAGGLGLAVAVEASFPTGGSAPFATEGGVTVTPRLVLAWHAPGGGAVALNAGFRVRPGADVVDLAIGNELRVGIGGEIPLGHYGLALLAEVDGAVGFGDSARDPSGVDARKLPLEALGGLRFRPSDAVAISAGVGAGLSEGYGAADWRALLSVSIGAPTGAADAAPVDLDADPVGPDPVGAGPDGPPGDVGPGTPPDDADPGVPALPLPGEPGSPEALANAADPDADTDGVPLGVDACPDEPEDRDGFQDEDGCPDPDDDMDGILDARDACPREPEVYNGIADEDGCPDEGGAATPPVKATGDTLAVSGEVRFAPASAVLTRDGAEVVDGVAAFIRAHPEIWRVRVEGHTDNQGIPEQNVDLSERRAASVRRRLIAAGVAAERVATKGFGATVPIASNGTTVGRAQNRRVEFHVVERPAPEAPTPTAGEAP